MNNSSIETNNKLYILS